MTRMVDAGPSAKLTVVTLLVVLAGLPMSQVAAQFTPFEASPARFDVEVASGVAEDAAGAVSVAVFRGDDVVWMKG